LKTLVRDAGRFLRHHSAFPAAPEKIGARDPVAGPMALSGGTAFAPRGLAQDPSLSGPGWPSLPFVTQQESFSQQCTLQAVFDWYQGFLDGEIDERTSDSSADNSVHDPGLRTSRQTEFKQVIRGFPQFARQVVETEMDCVRVRFFHAGGREAGTVVLRPEADRCIIEVPGGPLFVVRETTVLDDLTGDLKSTGAEAIPIPEVE